MTLDPMGFLDVLFFQTYLPYLDRGRMSKYEFWYLYNLNDYASLYQRGLFEHIPRKALTTRAARCDLCEKSLPPGAPKFWIRGKYWVHFHYLCLDKIKNKKSTDADVPRGA